MGPKLMWFLATFAIAYPVDQLTKRWIVTHFHYGENLTIVSEQPAGKKDIVVRTRIDRPSGPPIKADWRVRTTENRYRIIDIMVEGISMVLTQRSEFGALIKRKGMNGLLAVLRARVDRMPATASAG